MIIAALVLIGGFLFVMFLGFISGFAGDVKHKCTDVWKNRFKGFNK